MSLILGGTPAQHVSQSSCQVNSMVEEMNDLPEARVPMKGLALEPGAYTLEIEDASDRQLTRHFQATPPTEIPALPQQALSEASSPSLWLLRFDVWSLWMAAYVTMGLISM